VEEIARRRLRRYRARQRLPRRADTERQSAHDSGLIKPLAAWDLTHGVWLYERMPKIQPKRTIRLAV